jgi:hypothetical protein
MYHYDEAIRGYESDCVRLPEAIKNKLRDHRNANRDRLKRNVPTKIRISGDNFIPQGSMAIGTTIQCAENDYDIDDGAWFYKEDLVHDSGAEMTSREVQKMVCDALADKNFNKQPEIHNNCVRVFYAEGHHVDVPAYRLLNAGTDNEKQQLAGAGGFMDSNPTQINSWFEKRVVDLNDGREDAGSQLRRMVRKMKRFARSRGDDWDMPNGLKLTMLAEECLPSGYERDDEGFYYLLRALQSRLAISLEVENRAQDFPRDKLTKTTADANMLELKTRVTEALGKLAVLHTADCDRDDAAEAWDWVFQSDGYFTSYNKDAAKTHALFEKRALINAGVAATTATGGIVTSTSAAAIVRNIGHSFYGDA